MNYILQKQLGGTMEWALRFDVPVVNDNGSQNQASLLNIVDQVFNITPRPFTGPAIKLELTNNDPNYAATITLVNAAGNYYAFPSLGNAGSGSNDAQWCSVAAAGASCPDSNNVDTLSNQKSLKILITPSSGPAVFCPQTVDLTAGYHHVQIYYSNPTPSCVVN